MPAGRPSTYTEELAAEICARLTEGESLRKICRDDDMPAISSVFLWMAKHPAFSEQYARARDEQADTLADEILSISDGFDGQPTDRDRLRVDARKWVASKLKPKRYGDKTAIEHSGSLEVTKLTDDELDQRLREKLAEHGL